VDLARSHLRMSCAAGLASHLSHYFGAADFEDRGQSAPEFGRGLQASWTGSCTSWSCWIIQRTVIRAAATTSRGYLLLPSTYKVGAIRVSSQKRAVLRIGNKACPLLVFIGKETQSGVWRNKPADFLDLKLVQDVSHSWV
jgi:hypothetical protein